MNTYYRVKATGQWCAPAYENGGADPDAIAETLGLLPGTVESVEVEEGDPRTGELLADPNITAEPVSPAPAAAPITVIATALLADPNLSPETKAAIQHIAGGAEGDVKPVIMAKG